MRASIGTKLLTAHNNIPMTTIAMISESKLKWVLLCLLFLNFLRKALYAQFLFAKQ